MPTEEGENVADPSDAFVKDWHLKILTQFCPGVGCYADINNVSSNFITQWQAKMNLVFQLRLNVLLANDLAHSALFVCAMQFVLLLDEKDQKLNNMHARKKLWM